MSDIVIQAATVPVDQAFPPTVQSLVNLIAGNLRVTGLDALSGIIVSPTEPSPGDRDKAWLKQDPATGRTLGLYTYKGGWIPVPAIVPKGDSAHRPASTSEGEIYFDTDIQCMLVFERAQWRTLAGTPGDIKHVAKETLAEALKFNPGWSQFTAASGRVLGAAGDGSGLTSRKYNDSVGEETHTLTEEELPAHQHDYKLPKGSNADNGDPGQYITTASSEANTSLDEARQTELAGEDAAHNNMQPTLFVWCLKKD